MKRKRARMKKLFDSKLQNRTTFEGAKRIWTCWEKETPRLDSTLLTKPFHRLPLLCNLNSYSVVLHRKLVLEQLQAEKAPPCLWTASVSSTARYRGWRALQNAVWKTLPRMRPELWFVESGRIFLWGKLKQNFSDWAGQCWWIGKGNIVFQDKFALSHQAEHRPAQSCSDWVCHNEEPSPTNHIFHGMLHLGPFHNDRGI